MSKYIEEELLKLIEKNYNEPHRVYHNLNHIKNGLKVISKLECDGYTVTDNQKTAWLFHDIVYKLNGSDNEKESADLFCEYNQKYKLNFNEKDVREIVNIILDTKSHIPSISASKLVLDIDMFIFAVPYEQFIEYRNQIKKEFSDCFSPSAFDEGTKAFINYYLKDPEKIFSTSYFKSFTEKAVENLSMYLENEI